MKLIEVLSKLEKYEIPNKTKFKWGDRVVINKNGTLYCNDMFFSKILNFGNVEALKEELEIIEEDKPIEKLLDNSVNYNFSKTQKRMTKEDRSLLDSNFRELGNKINELVDEVNKLKKESVK